MKKITILLLGIFYLTSCGCNEHNGYIYSEETFEEAVQNMTELVEITYNGETHEYILFHGSYQGSLSHWEGCKYCKQKRK